MKLFKATTTAPRCQTPFVDWYEATDESHARKLWEADCKANGLPEGSTVIFVECDPETLKPLPGGAPVENLDS